MDSQCAGEIHQVRVLFAMQENQPGFSPGRGERPCDLARAPSPPGAQTFLATERAGATASSPRGAGCWQPHGWRERVTVNGED